MKSEPLPPLLAVLLPGVLLGGNVRIGFECSSVLAKKQLKETTASLQECVSGLIYNPSGRQQEAMLLCLDTCNPERNERPVHEGFPNADSQAFRERHLTGNSNPSPRAETHIPFNTLSFACHDFIPGSRRMAS